MSPNGSGTSRSSSAASMESPSRHDSNDTVDYDLSGLNGDIIDLSSTQFMTQAPVGIGQEEEDDDDVVLIPQHVETIDLCSESFLANVRPPASAFRRDEVIEIVDSPAPPHRAGARRESPVMRAPRQANRTSPYKADAAAHKSPPKPRNLNLDDSQNDGNEPTQRVKISCPICFDSSMKKKMVSTKCGHIHCEDCLKMALRNLGKKCPVCRKALTGKEPYHPIFFTGQ